MSNMNSATKTMDLVHRGLAKRRRAEKRFRWYGVVSIAVGIFALVALFVEIFSSGLGGFQQTRVRLEVHFDPEVLEITDARDESQVQDGNYEGIVRAALAERFPEVTERR